MAFTMAFTLEQYTPDGYFATAEIKNGFLSPPILFFEFAELLKTYLESREVEEQIPVSTEKNGELEQKKINIAERLTDKARTCMGEGEKLEDYLHPQDIKTAIDYYYVLVEARNILTSTMGRALYIYSPCWPVRRKRVVSPLRDARRGGALEWW